MDSFGAGKPESNQAKRCANQVIPAESTTISADFVSWLVLRGMLPLEIPYSALCLQIVCWMPDGQLLATSNFPSISADFVFGRSKPPPVIQVRQHIWMEGCLWKQRNTGHTQHDIQLCAAKDFALQEQSSGSLQFRYRIPISHRFCNSLHLNSDVITGQVNHIGFLPSK
jgi:hypothetical protein